jgi:integral membrane protein
VFAINKLLTKFESYQLFSEKDAWSLFRLAAICEACGWTMLITGILLKRYVTVGNNVPVLIAGQIHGMLFLSYIVAVVVLYANLGWSRKRMLVAGMASVPPYGSLIFEQWAAYKRRSKALKTYRRVYVYGLIINKNKLLTVQPKDSGFWWLPGGEVMQEETMQTALRSSLKDQTGVSAEVGKLCYMVQDRLKSTEQLTCYFVIDNQNDFNTTVLSSVRKTREKVDEIAFMNPKNNEAIMPEFLRHRAVILEALDNALPTQLVE